MTPLNPRFPDRQPPIMPSSQSSSSSSSSELRPTSSASPASPPLSQKRVSRKAPEGANLDHKRQRGVSSSFSTSSHRIRLLEELSKDINADIAFENLGIKIRMTKENKKEDYDKLIKALPRLKSEFGKKAITVILVVPNSEPISELTLNPVATLKYTELRAVGLYLSDPQFQYLCSVLQNTDPDKGIVVDPELTIQFTAYIFESTFGLGHQFVQWLIPCLYSALNAEMESELKDAVEFGVMDSVEGTGGGVSSGDGSDDSYDFDGSFSENENIDFDSLLFFDSPSTNDAQLDSKSGRAPSASVSKEVSDDDMYGGFPLGGNAELFGGLDLPYDLENRTSGLVMPFSQLGGLPNSIKTGLELAIRIQGKDHEDVRRLILNLSVFWEEIFPHVLDVSHMTESLNVLLKIYGREGLVEDIIKGISKQCLQTQNAWNIGCYIEFLSNSCFYDQVDAILPHYFQLCKNPSEGEGRDQYVVLMKNHIRGMTKNYGKNSPSVLQAVKQCCEMLKTFSQEESGRETLHYLSEKFSENSDVQNLVDYLARTTGEGMKAHDPLRIHNELLKKSIEEVDHKPQPYVCEGQTFNMNLGWVKTPPVVAQIPFSYNQFQNMLQQLHSKIDSNPETRKQIQNVMTVSYANIQAEMELDYYLALLDSGEAASSSSSSSSTPNSSVPSVTAYRLKTYLNYVQENSEGVVDEYGLSQGDWALIQLLKNVSTCGPGKDIGVDRSYYSLPNEVTGANAVEASSSKDVDGRLANFKYSVHEELRRYRLDTIARGLVEGFAGLNQEDNANREQYQNHLIGKEIGLFPEGHKIKFDVNARYIPQAIINTSKQETLDQFYAKYTTEKVIDWMHDYFNDPHQFKAEKWRLVYETLGGHEGEVDPRYVRVEEKDGFEVPVEITKLGVARILYSMGILVTVDQ